MEQSDPESRIKELELELSNLKSSIKAAKQTEKALQESEERKKAEEALKESQNLLQKAENISNQGSWKWDVINDEWYFSENWLKIHGFEKSKISKEELMEIAYPDDRSKIDIAFDNALRNKIPYLVEHRIIRKDNGEVRVIKAVGEVHFLDNGKPDFMIGVAQDITQNKHHENELIKAKEKAEESEKQIKRAQQTAKVGNWIWYIKENRLWWSDEMYNIFEIDKDTFTGKLDEIIERAIHPEDKKAVEQSNHSVMVKNKPIPVEFRINTKDGNQKYVLGLADVITLDENGKSKLLSGIVKDITDYKIVQIELIRAKEKAEESDRLKSAFLANMSHEIRTPMNGILGFAELLKKSNLTGKQQQQYLEIIGQSGKRMLDTINSIVDISKIEAGLESVFISESNVNELTKSLYEFFKPMAEGKGLHFSLSNGLSTHAASINTDLRKFNSILTNLIGNAVKFAEKGSIEFGYENKGECLEFFVKDTGIGIPKDRLDAIFERFIKADIEDKRVFEGNGLGLAISKSYVEMLGGKMWVESLEGKGTTFYFTLPYNIESKDKTAIDNAASEKGKEVKTKPNISRLKILVAEDDDVSFILLTDVLDEMSSEIIRAITGKEVVTLCSDNPDIDLILMDIKMPDMNGYEATAEIRKFNKEVVVIAQTAYGLAGDREKALDAGCNDYIYKPVDIDILKGLIKKHCNN